LPRPNSYQLNILSSIWRHNWASLNRKTIGERNSTIYFFRASFIQSNYCIEMDTIWLLIKFCYYNLRWSSYFQ